MAESHEVGTTHKTVTLLHQGDSLFAGLSFDPFMTVEHNLNIERGMAAHLDGEMPPLPVNDVKVIMVHIRPWRFPLQVDVVLPFLDLPHQSWGFCDEDEEDTGNTGISGKVFFSELMLSDAWGTVDEGNCLLLGTGMDPAAEGPRHSLKVGGIQAGIRTRQFFPPRPQAPSFLSQGEITVDHNTVDTVIHALEERMVVLGEVIDLGHCLITSPFEYRTGKYATRRGFMQAHVSEYL